MRQSDLEEGIAKYKTPLYIFGLDELRKHVEQMQHLLGDEIRICYAMKANPFLVSHMESLVDRIEVCSMGEFEICRERKVAPENVLISGVLKKKEDIHRILDYYGGKATYTVESVEQFRYFAKWSKEHQEKITVYLRLTSGNQFGIDEQAIGTLLNMRDSCPFLHIKGIHFFSGTQKRNVRKIEKELLYLDEFLLQLEEEMQISIEDLEFGPGLNVSYFEGQIDTKEEDLKTIGEVIKNMKWKGNVTLEMGRALVAECGYYVTSVLDMKQNKDKNYCIVDGGIHQMNYDGQLKGMYQPKLCTYPVREKDSKMKWTICGSLCTVNDILVQNVELAGLKLGDALIFENAGAYSVTEGMALFLSHELPKVVFYSETKGWNVVRNEKQTYVDNMEKEIEEWIL